MDIDIREVYDNLYADNDADKEEAYLHYKQIKAVPVEVWFEQINDSDNEKRAQAIYALGVTRRKEAINLLIDTLADADASVRKSAAFSLSFFDNPLAIEPLINAIKDDNWEVRFEALRSLQYVKEIAEDQSETIMKANSSLLKDPEPKVRARATYYLRGFHQNRYVNDFMSALNDPEIEVIGSALNALWLHYAFQPCELKLSIIDKLKHPDKQIRITAIHTLEDAYPDDKFTIDTLISALHDPDADIRNAAAETLFATSGIRAHRAVANAIGDEDERVKGRAIAISGYLGRKGKYKRLIEYLDNPSSDIRAGAAGGLLGLKKKKALDRLIRLYEEDPDPVVRLTALTVNKKLGKSKSQKYIIKGLKDSSSIVRRYASSKVKLGSNSPYIESLMELLDDCDAEVRSNVISKIGYITWYLDISDSPNEAESSRRKSIIEKVTAAVFNALDDIDHRVRESAREAIENLDSEQAVEYLLEKANQGDIDSQRALGYRKHPSLIEPMKELYKSENSKDRKHAVSILGMYKDPQIIDLLFDAASDQNLSVRESAAYYLSYINDNPKVLDTLYKLLNDENANIRVLAIKSFRQSNSRDVLNVLIKALDDPVSKVREAAAETLMNISTVEAETALLKKFNSDNPEIVKSACEFYIRKGIPGSEQVFIDLINKDNREIATDVAFCGNPILEKAAKKYYKEYCFPSKPKKYRYSPKWGSDK